MKDFVSKTPLVFIYLCVFSSLVYRLLALNAIIQDDWMLNVIFGLTSTVSVIIWILSVVSFFSFYSKSKKYNSIIYMLLSTVILDYAFLGMYGDSLVFILGILPVYLAFTFLLSFKIRSVFDSRSLWFVFMEVFVLPLGIINITYEIKRFVKKDQSNLDVIDQ
jgi:hypothetical protein